MRNKQRRHHTKEFKEEAVKLVSEQGYAISEAARNLGINPNLLGRWKREMDMSRSAYSGSVSRVNMQAELKHLRKENKRLKLDAKY